MIAEGMGRFSWERVFGMGQPLLSFGVSFGFNVREVVQGPLILFGMGAFLPRRGIRLFSSLQELFLKCFLCA